MDEFIRRRRTAFHRYPPSRDSGFPVPEVTWVKSIGEQSGVRMPSFFGYFMLAVIILLPVFVVVNLLFL